MSRVSLKPPVRCRVVSMVVVGLMIHLLARNSLSEEVDLSPRFELGATYQYVSSSRIDHEIQIDSTAAPEETRVRTKAGMAFEVTRVEPDGSATIAWTLKYLSISADGMIPGIDGMLDYDSRRPDAGMSPLAPLFARFVDNPVAVRINAKGNVVDFQQVGAGGLTDPFACIRVLEGNQGVRNQGVRVVENGEPEIQHHRHRGSALELIVNEAYQDQGVKTKGSSKFHGSGLLKLGSFNNAPL